MLRGARAVFNFIDRYAAVFVVIGLLGVTGLWLTQRSDEGKSCRIQSTGLEAQRHLTQVLEAFNVFLQPPPKGVVKAKQPPVPTYYEYSLKAVRYHLPRYLALERKQPSHRTC